MITKVLTYLLKKLDQVTETDWVASEQSWAVQFSSMADGTVHIAYDYATYQLGDSGMFINSRQGY